jgi:hypothetical protein
MTQYSSARFDPIVLAAAKAAKTPKMRIAVIGAGIAGNAASWNLSKRTPVTVHEREILGIPVIRQRVFEQDCAKRFAIRRSNFRTAWPNLMPSDFNDRFRRRCEDDIADCEAGFLPANIGVRQMVFAKLGSFALHNA